MIGIKDSPGVALPVQQIGEVFGNHRNIYGCRQCSMKNSVGPRLIDIQGEYTRCQRMLGSFEWLIVSQRCGKACFIGVRETADA